MVFDVTPDQISRLEPKQLVDLLRRLLFSEARATNVAMSGISVPLKITVPDGGEDGRIVWEGGAAQTDYLPARFCLFQAKASNLTPAGWKKEAWTKSSRSRNKVRKLSKAVQAALSAKGAYIAFTTADIVQTRIDEIKTAISDGIQQAKGQAGALKSIEVYNAEKIALWCMKHPPVAIWVNEQQSGLALKGFQTLGSWGRRQGFSSLKSVEDKKARYVLEKRADEPADRAANALTVDQAQKRISDEIRQAGKCVRIYGPSGVGKTRFIFNALSGENTIESQSQNVISIFCDYRDVSVSINSIASALVEERAEAILVVDECPRDIAVHLSEIVSAEGSKLCKIEQSDVFFALDSSARTLIKELATSHPFELWDEFSEFALIATPMEMHWFEELIGPGRNFDDVGNGPGPLFSVPEELVLRWAEEDPLKRVPFLFQFIPVLVDGDNSQKKWHSIVENVIGNYGQLEGVRDALARRIHPRAWSGSLVPYLEIYLEPLAKWFVHSVPEVAAWARQLYRGLERRIEKEKREDEEEEQ